MNIAELESVKKIKQLDLEPIVFKLTASEKGRPPKLSLAQADRGVELYRQFLILNALYPTSSIVPTEEIDEIWHAHILDTAKYRQDCHEIFGKPLDHFPYLGLRGQEDEKNWRDAFAQTSRLFEEHFGTKLSAQSAACGESCGSSLCDGGSCDGNSCTSTGGGDDAVVRERPRPIRPIVSV